MASVPQINLEYNCGGASAVMTLRQRMTELGLKPLQQTLYIVWRTMLDAGRSAEVVAELEQYVESARGKGKPEDRAMGIGQLGDIIIHACRDVGETSKAESLLHS